MESIRKYRLELIMFGILFLGMIITIIADKMTGSDIARPFFGIWFVAFFVLETYRKIVKIDIYEMCRNIRDNKVLLRCMAIGSIMMLITHMFVYTNAIYNHDAIGLGGNIGGYINGGGEKWASYIIRFITMGMNLPWLSGVITIISVSISLFLLVTVLHEKDSFSIFIMAGVLATNSSLIAHHTYVGGEHVAGVTILLICLAIYYTCKDEDKISGFIKSVLLIAFATGMYGAYTPLYPSVLIGLLMLALLRGKEPVHTVMIRGFRFCITFLSGMILYYVGLKISLWYSDAVMTEYMGENKIEHGINFIELISLIPAAFIRCVQYYLGLDDYYPSFIRVIKAVLTIIMIITVILVIGEKKENMKKEGRIVWFLLLLIIWPVSINLIKILTFGNTHFLMAFTFVTPYLFIPKAVRWLYNNKDLPVARHFNAFLVVMTFLFIYGGIIFANSIYIHIEDMELINQSIATRLLDRIEQVEGFTGDEKVIILGDINYDEYFKHSTLNDNNLKMLDVNSIAQLERANGFTYPDTIPAFLKNIYNSKLDYETQPSVEDYISDSGIPQAEADYIREMPEFPKTGGVAKFDDKIYVKFKDEGESIGFSTGNKSEIYKKIREIYRKYIGIK